MNPVHTSSASQEWRTPPEFLDIVRKMGQIVLDPATTDANPTGADVFFTAEYTGLVPRWDIGGLVYCNPPYGRDLVKWTEKFAIEGDRWGAELITLTPARTDTRWFQQYMIEATAHCFLRGRLRFHQQGLDGLWTAADACPFPCLVSYWGHQVELFRETFYPHGWIP